ncbi:hypothetical protein NPIL_136541 [Nephila pilipes]|uniref:Uncharacterized protein n=1 Tax=Nephila pilipes TaxID=299642 RepID=A0A8X6NYM5_NEPPI|nr:hypothetical protein NPIL_136541 [Nephila pilipes]
MQAPQAGARDKVPIAKTSVVTRLDKMVGCRENTSTVFPWSTGPDNWLIKKVSRSSRRSWVIRPPVNGATQTGLGERKRFKTKPPGSPF